MTDVFISYKREERAKARAVAEALVQRGYSVWWDVELLPGDRFADDISNIIQKAKAAIVLWSRASVKSDFVRSEAELARRREILVPVLLDDCSIPLPFGGYHTLDLSRWDGQSDDRALSPLIEAIEARVSPSRDAVSGSAEKDAALHVADEETKLWREITSGKRQSAREYELYLARFGDDSLFGELARIRIEHLKNEAKDKGKKGFKGLVGASAALVALLAAILGVALQGKEIADWLWPALSLKDEANVPSVAKREPSADQNIKPQVDSSSSGPNQAWVAEQLRKLNGQRIVFRSAQFPEVQILVTGDIHKYVPPYAVQLLLDTKNIAYVDRHRGKFESAFVPLINLGKELRMTNYVRTDQLGIRLKTNYASGGDRNRVIQIAAKIIFELYYDLGGLAPDAKISVERYDPSRHLAIPFDLWPQVEKSDW